jgi:hypothetical protein
VSPASVLFSPQDHALVPIFSAENGWLALDAVLGDPALRSGYRFSMGSPLQSHVPSTDDIIPILDFGQTTYALRPNIFHMIADSLNRIADFILCAANHHNPWAEGGRPDIPTSIPQELLDELGTRIPGIILFRMYDIRETTFPTVESALEYMLLAKRVYHYSLNWIANVIRQCVEIGYRSGWRWGTPLAMAQTECTHRITRHFTYDGHTALERFMGHQLTRNEMDFGVQHLFHHASLLMRSSQDAGRC